MSNSDAQLPVLPYELCLGVTGHRQLSDPLAVERAIRGSLEQVTTLLESASTDFVRERTLNHNWSQRLDDALAYCLSLAGRTFYVSSKGAKVCTPVHWVTITSLAEGVDQIAASVTLERPNSRIEVITPFADQDDYRKSMSTPQAVVRFDELLAKDPHPLQLGYKRDGADETLAYARAGEAVVEQCELLLAVWDGRAPRGKGGTAEIVRYAVLTGRKVLWIDANAPDSPVKMYLPGHEERALDELRKSGRDFHALANSAIWQALPSRARQLSADYHKLSACNRDATFNSQEAARGLATERARLAEHARAVGIESDGIRGVNEHVLPELARFDASAVEYQRLYTKAGRWLHVLPVLAVSTVVIQVFLFPERLWLICLEIVAMIGSVLSLRVSRNEAWHEKWLSARHTAERLRVAVSTVITSPRSLGLRSDHAERLMFYSGPQHWMEAAARSVAQRAAQGCDPALPLDALRSFVNAYWIVPQASWFEERGEEKQRSAERYHHMSLALFLLTLTMAVLHLFGVGHHSLLGDGIVIAAIVLPSAGGALHAYSSLLELERIAARYQRMAALFRAASIRCTEADSKKELHQEVQRLAETALRENSEWLLSLSSRGLVLAA